MKEHKHANYRSYCSEEHKNQHDRDRYHAEPSRQRRLSREWAAANRERMLENVKRWMEENPERVREAKRKYDRAHPEVKAASVRRRRARLLNAPGSHSIQEMKDLFIRFDFKCVYGMPGCKEIALTVDHIIPLHRGGSDYAENLMPACKSCNSKKHTRTPRELVEDGLLDPSHPLADASGFGSADGLSSLE